MSLRDSWQFKAGSYQAKPRAYSTFFSLSPSKRFLDRYHSHPLAIVLDVLYQVF
ncbi:hypothetical protein ALO95_200381 [Pseudomonas syringae pv. antirrhini]|nr:hypothetical protein ALQ23_200258 [Pseudomonas syringae pv. antirrhini]RMW23460.1 hypothetical protein ALO95_200381 [Pseudomonas syringae pv. antirrhini]